MPFPRSEKGSRSIQFPTDQRSTAKAESRTPENTYHCVRDIMSVTETQCCAA